MKRITQTKEIQTGDNSGVVFSGNEKAAYTGDFELIDFSAKELITLAAAQELLSSALIPTLAPWVSGSIIMEDDYRTFVIDGTEYLFRSKIDNNETTPSLSTSDWAVIGSASQNLQSVTDTGNVTTNALQITDSSNLNDSLSSVIIARIGDSGIVANLEGDRLLLGVGLYSQLILSEADSENRVAFFNGSVAGDQADAPNQFPTLDQVNSLIADANPSAGNQPIVVTGSSLVINWQTDVVPWDTLGRTYATIYGNTITSIAGSYSTGVANEFQIYYPNTTYTRSAGLIGTVTLNDIFPGTIIIL